MFRSLSSMIHRSFISCGWILVSAGTWRPSIRRCWLTFRLRWIAIGRHYSLWRLSWRLWCLFSRLLSSSDLDGYSSGIATGRSAGSADFRLVLSEVFGRGPKFRSPVEFSSLSGAAVSSESGRMSESVRSSELSSSSELMLAAGEDFFVC